MTKQQLHSRISYVKSILRLAGYVMLLFWLLPAVIVLFLSEVGGIIEEVIYE